MFQLENLGVGINLGEVEDVVNIGPAEGIDALCIIPHHTYVLVILSQLQHNAVLCKVGILILIDQNIAELILIAGQHLGVVAKQQESIEQQIIKIHCIRLPASFPIPAVDIADCRHLCRTVSFVGFFVIGITVRGDEMILGIGNARLHYSGFVYLLIEPHLLDDRAQKAFAVRRIVNGEL